MERLVERRLVTTGAMDLLAGPRVPASEVEVAGHERAAGKAAVGCGLRDLIARLACRREALLEQRARVLVRSLFERHRPDPLERLRAEGW